MEYFTSEQKERIDKLGINPETFAKLIEGFVADAESVKITPDGMNKYLWHRVITHFRKTPFGGAKKMIEYVVIGTNITDFGQQKKYDAAIKLYTSNKNEAIRTGVVSDKGEPIQPSGFNKGKPIKAVNGKVDDLTKQLIVLWRELGEDNFHTGTISMKVTADRNPTTPLFCLIEGEVSVSPKAKVGQFNYSMDGKVSAQLSDHELEELFKRTCPESFVALGGALDALAQQDRGYDAFCVVRADLGPEGVMIAEKTNRMEIIKPVEPTDDFDLPGANVWISKMNRDIQLFIRDGATGLFVVGRPSWNSERKETSINAYGVWVDSSFIVERDSAPIAPQDAVSSEDEYK